MLVEIFRLWCTDWQKLWLQPLEFPLELPLSCPDGKVLNKMIVPLKHRPPLVPPSWEQSALVGYIFFFPAQIQMNHMNFHRSLTSIVWYGWNLFGILISRPRDVLSSWNSNIWAIALAHFGWPLMDLPPSLTWKVPLLTHPQSETDLLKVNGVVINQPPLKLLLLLSFLLS